MMRIERVEIKNFRQYKNVVFDFEKTGKYDLHIILGNNGIGKTNLLNAISWCLYGKESHLGNEKSARKRINSTVLEDAIEAGEPKCCVTVAVTIGVDNKRIKFERSQEFKANKDAFEFKPSFVVTVIAPTGNDVITDSERIDNLIKQYLPEDIKEYFFFDGEQLDKYFISNQGEKIHQAIFNISQVNLLDSMSDRLGKVIHDFQIDAGSKNVGIKDLNAKKSAKEMSVNDLKMRIAECKKQISLADSEITICNEYLAGKDGVPDKEKEYQEVSYQIEAKEVEFANHMISFNYFIREYKVLFAMYPKLKKTLNLVNEKEGQGQLPPNIDRQFLERMLKYHKCLICDRDMDDTEEEAVRGLLKQLELSTTVSHLLVKMKGPLEDSIERCQRYPEARAALVEKEKSLTAELKQLRERFDKLDAFLKNYSDKDKIREMHEKRSKFQDLKKKNEEDRIKLEVQLDNAQKELASIENELAKAIQKQEDLAELEKKIVFAKKSLSIVREIEMEMMDEVKDKMTVETMNIFGKLDWKTKTFDHIELDDSYNLELFDSYGYPMVGACSAAERALLALSFTLALQKVSGYDSMLFIDTPVGRVDLENRANFAEVLNQLSENKQVIMTFTPSEYSQEIRNVLEPCSSTYKELVTVDEKETYIK
ncbi:MAG: AAA family ATPase [bacterium]|nr:AAA family ATPase [bacterium]